MSRIGNKPIQIPNNTKVSYTDKLVTVTGEKGTLTHTVHAAIDIKIADDVINVVTLGLNKKEGAFQGLTRALINNMVNGVSKGFERSLDINGIGYRAELSGKKIILNIGYSNPVEFDLPEGITADVEKTKIKLSGIDKQLIGQTAARIRELRPPEPYKGKGIKYTEEIIQRKAGKTAAA
ncbi:MAG: 50S ribosomal protein L6 [Desulfobacterales bacterium]|nr:50S ribosomal protein L6 [Desulfobacterales bacterium]MCP4162513.1 50S ribosomal protein L6 [Deltaproteobacteria bacterium]